MKVTVSVLTGFVFAHALTTLNAAVLGFQPAATTVPVGGAFQVELTVSGLGVGMAPSLGVFDLDVAYDPSVIALDSVGFGDPSLGDQLDLSGFGSITSVDDSVPGLVNVFELSLDSIADLDALQANSFALCVFTFTPWFPGVSDLTISVNALGDSSGNPLPADVARGSVMVVPEPSLYGLALALGLLGWITVSHRKIRSARA